MTNRICNPFDYIRLKDKAPLLTCGHVDFVLDCSECWKLNAYLYDEAGLDTWDDPRAWETGWAIVKGHKLIPGLRQVAFNAASVEERRAIRRWISEWKEAASVACHWCKRSFAPKQCHADHVIPLSKGGLHSLANLVIACAPCNLKKRDAMPGEWLLEMGGSVHA